MKEAYARWVSPEVFLVGYTAPDMRGIRRYLASTYQAAFIDEWESAVVDGVEPGEALVSLFAKLCYRSLVPGKNTNVSKVRSISDNLTALLESAHGSVFEHVSLNFIVTHCSRVFTHELVRHRVGTAFSQTSGRYVRAEPGEWDLVVDPILLDPEARGVLSQVMEHLDVSVYLLECALGLRVPNEEHPQATARACLGENGGWSEHEEELDKMWRPVYSAEMPFSEKKKRTSAVRRILPNGMANEIAVTLNVRALRHTIQMRTSRHSEWEIRYVFQKIYRLCKEKWPNLFADAQEEEVDGLVEVTGMKMLPYEKTGD